MDTGGVIVNLEKTMEFDQHLNDVKTGAYRDTT